MTKVLRTCDLGQVKYAAGLALQERLFEQRAAGKIPDTLLLLEHTHVFTLGRSADESNILEPRGSLERSGIDVEQTGRGGDVTYHGPGQLVGYPIVSLRESALGVSDYVSALEEAIICLLAEYGISAGRDERNRGVWVGNNKIAAIGLRVRKGVSIHGFALNVSTDLALYGKIVPCGITDAGVTSMFAEGVHADLEEVKARICTVFARQLGYDRLESIGAADLNE